VFGRIPDFGNKPAGRDLALRAARLAADPSAPTKPIRYWFAMGDQDLFYPNPVMVDGMHDWVLSAERMAKVPLACPRSGTSS
jgi:hypothetical protein